MACNENIKIMHDYLDGHLSKEDENCLSAHLETCEDCQNHFQELNRTLTLIQSARRIDAPEDFTKKVMQRLPDEKKNMKIRRWFSKHPYLPAVAVLMLFIIGSMFSGWGKGTELVVSKQDNLIIEGDTVIVPEDIVVSGDLLVKNGNLKVEGKIDGDVILVNGELLNDSGLTASLDNISGELKLIDQAIKWAFYELNNFFKNLFKIK